MDRKQITKQKLREAFWQAYAEKPIEKITVRELTDQVGLNRVTFYAHYPDIYAIREEMEDEFIARLDTYARDQQKRAVRLSEDSIRETLVELDTSLLQYSPYIQLLLGPNGDGLFRERLKQTFVFGQSEQRKGMTLQQEFLLEHIFSVEINTFLHWLRMGKFISIEQLASICYKLIVSGIGTDPWSESESWWEN